MISDQQSPTKMLAVGAEVLTPRGIGRIHFVYPKGPHHKITYAVVLEGCRYNRIFDEGQLKLLGDVQDAPEVVNKKE